MSPLALALGVVLLAIGVAMIVVGRARKGEPAPFLRHDFLAMIYLLACLLLVVAGSAIVIAQALAA
jgi:hypothetical protein